MVIDPSPHPGFAALVVEGSLADNDYFRFGTEAFCNGQEIEEKSWGGRRRIA
jgi:hypothetical protein